MPPEKTVEILEMESPEQAVAPPRAAPSDDDERTLARRACQQCCTHAWTVLFERHAAVVKQRVVRITNDDSLLTTVFERALKRRVTYDEDRGTFRGWLLGIASRVALETVSKQRRQPAPLDEDSARHGSDDTYDPEKHMLSNEEVSLMQRRSHWLYRTLDTIPLKESLALRLCDLGGMSSRQAADLMKISEDYVNNLRTRARRRLESLARKEKNV